VSSIDAVVYGFLGNAFYAPLETPPKATIAKYPKLVAYLNRRGNRPDPTDFKN
jgi:hypothetical protein